MKNFYTLGVFLFFVSVLFVGIGTRNALAGVPSTCFGTACTIECEDQPGDVCDGDEGTTGADVICGSDQADIINAGKGQDKACGYNGNDIISGGQSDDCLRGDNDDDTISGGQGNDRIEGGSGDDIELDGGKGADRVEGNNGDDNIFGGDDSDVSSSSSPGFGDCATTGGLFGGDNDDYIEGGMGIDTIDGNYDSDECDGGPQNDTYVNCECGDEGPLSGPQAGGETEALAPCM